MSRNQVTNISFDLESNKAICLNQTSALVWEHCDGKHSVSDISKELEKLGSEVSEDFVLLAINQLANEGLLLDSEELAERFRGLSRREAIRKVGFASMVALPIVSAITAPSSASAQSCLAPGTPRPNNPVSAFPTIAECGTYCRSADAQCCSGQKNAGLIYGPAGRCACAFSQCA